MQKAIKNLIYSLFVGAAGLYTLPVAAAGLTMPNIWLARFSSLKGDVSCNYGDPDCNRCAKDVELNFKKRGNDRVFSYYYKLRDSYQPSGMEPSDYLTRLPGPVEIGDTTLVGPENGSHIQSLARIPLDKNSTNAWFAGTYGGKDAAVFLVRMPTVEAGGKIKSDGQLKYVYRAKGNHPGGAQALGHYLFVGRSTDATGFVDIYDLRSPGNAVVRSIDIGQRISSVAVAKLAGGGYLILGKDSGDGGGYTPFYATSLDATKWEALPKIQAGSGVENISLVTECESRKLFLITATANGATGPSNFVYKQNIQQLYSFDGQPQLNYENEVRDDQSTDCDARASGTYFVDKDGDLRGYCSQKMASRSHETLKTCFLPTVPDFSGCDGKIRDKLKDWDCWKNAVKTVIPFGSGVDCLDFVKLDDHMSVSEY